MITGNEPALPMTMATQDGFAMSIKDYLQGDTYGCGLTIRQHFAAIAMQGICAGYQGNQPMSWEKIARNSVQLADALISELNKATQ